VGELITYPQLVSRHNREYREQQAALTVLEGSRNCAAAAGAALANADGTEHQLITHHAFRVAAGDPKNQAGEPVGLSSYGVERALQQYGAQAERFGPVSIWQVADALKAGRHVYLCIDYGALNKSYPKYSGQLTFTGGHAVVLEGFRRHDPRIGGRNSTQVRDSLYDGRCRDWGCAPPELQAQTAPFRAYRIAAGAFRPDGKTPIGTDKAVFIVVEPAA